ncbi:MAG: response regulator, partial [Candidatus Acidiferrum sp.]
MPPSILVTDDDATTRQMLRGILKKAGYSVATASDGMGALNAVRKKKFDLVLLDIWMPKMTGLGFLGHLHGERYIPK